MYKLSVDIGGTFTDLVLLNTRTGEMNIGKISSTPKDFTEGVLEIARKVMEKNNIAPSTVDAMVHGTTVGTNALLERKLPKTGLLTTRGFRDLLEIKRGWRPNLYDLYLELPPPLVPRDLILEVSERTDGGGNVIEPLCEDDVRKAVHLLMDKNVRSIAVCYLFSMLNPIHEQRTQAIIHEEGYDGYVSISSDVSPIFREFNRLSSTVINSCLLPIVEAYLTSLEKEVRNMGILGPLYGMTSGGGIASIDDIRTRPIDTIESGPAAGAVAAAYLSELLDEPRTISLDMGGTTSKACLLNEGEPSVTYYYEVGGGSHGGIAVVGKGYPISGPHVDLAEIGAGGGSIAWIDPAGGLHVGPQSAGAEPGPACYGRGGREPTNTDAAVVLGYIDPDYFLGGEMKLYRDLSEKAIKEKIANPLGFDLLEAARGIIKIENTSMLEALRIVSIEKGCDPREYSLIAFGGAGPMYACQLAQELQMPKVIIPPSPGIFSAYGLLTSDVLNDYSLSIFQESDNVDLNELTRLYEQLEQKAIEHLAQSNVPKERIKISRLLDMRYVGQGYELTIPVESGKATKKIWKAIIERFHSTHKKLYGQSTPEAKTEFTCVRVKAVGAMGKLSFARAAKGNENPRAALKGTRRVCFESEMREFSIYNRYKLLENNMIEGPCIVEEDNSTTLVPPAWRATVDLFGVIHITRK